ncbi:hypothetical protein JAAARDRAFT_305437 [Jaapia argillacea MUCL 33604]|uniref:Guanine nucleotide-binding protein subunit alpha n=1 Tax=Jaapia argillacea MUCL 33604 TaxID=933084 RepID=A0A067PQX7_9AGAM|nr:hypothetical protein JAAARDRAFT_305437 [Jaapia argillacea MUCL 33604]
MGNCVSGGDADAKARSHQIDKEIHEDSKRLKRECKILLLGSGESGKSTIVKQMKILHQGGFTDDELLAFRHTIYRNLLDSAQAIVEEMRTSGVECEVEATRPKIDLIAGHSVPVSDDEDYTFPPEIAQAIYDLWKDPIIPSIMERANQFYIMDNAAYFFDRALRIGTPNYLPTVKDVLRARVKSTGIVETRFKMDELSIHMFDVGGQRSERKKWIHCFESVTSIIFCTALSEYDQVLLEERKTNRMAESLVLFESVINSRWFLRTSIILFLNKIDVFKQKLPKVPLERYFPEYAGGTDLSKAAKYILWRFMQMNRARLNVYPHLTQATDTNNIKVVFGAVKETILQNALKESGIL